MRNVFRVILFFSLALFVFSSSAFAQASSNPASSKPAFVKNTDAAILKAGLDSTSRTKELEKLGWTVSGNSSPGVIPLSPAGCGSIANQPIMKQFDGSTGRYVYLVQANWQFSSSCSWDDTSGNAPDAVALAVTDQNGSSVNAQPEYAQIYTYTSGGTSEPNNCTISSYNGSGLTGTVTDTGGFFSLNVGYSGQVWFYIVQPTSGTSYYQRSQWTHTWSSTSTSLSGISLSYNPFNLTTTWSTGAPQQWQTADQSSVVFN
ncbi:hypothetical protein SAMN04487897_1605 [Paenibacillus sp. yr247]|uniref:hypothetical protein n=1 Tax=Paenibacillus sp. yr247 TaxID=1761880 RepID=UPI00088CA7FA|nr:hypothetical protein [Paenibacillus sp. yr247]SDP26666.1 hypothetical protein SAMN04487897_1605 [Paenibacillus sp. yr247]